MTEHTYHIWADGGSRGNPGQAAYGFVLKGPGIVPFEHGERIGIATNNVAEYTATIEALKKLKSLVGSDKARKETVRVHADSELLVKQMNGEYKVKDANLKKLYMELHNIILDFDAVSFTHVPREENKKADAMVNQALDRDQAALKI